ncbi:MAG: SRPBCC domain-containing protein [Bacteroidia bacterium]|nr:SRPBCC domain-containing protein [Bacteroidia bacterium]
MDKFKISVKLHCPVKDVFTGWLNDKVHSEFSGGAQAKIDPKEGGKFSVWDGYITGTNIEIFPYKRIVQKWRSSQFADTDEDSLLELFFTYKDDYTLITITHSNLPDGFEDKYKKGWKDNYLKYMKKYFEK